MSDKKSTHLNMYNLCVCTRTTSSFKHKSLKVEENAPSLSLSHLAEFWLHFKVISADWGLATEKVKGGPHAIEESEEIQYTQARMQTCRRTHFSTGGSSGRFQRRGRLQRDPTEAEQTNSGGPGPREMIEPTDGGEKLQTTCRMER